MNQLPGDQAAKQAKPMRTVRDFARTQRRRDRVPTAPVSRGDVAGAAFLFGTGPGRGLIAREWPHMALPMVLGVGGLAIANWTVRPIISPVLALLASALLFVARFAATYEERREHSTAVRMGLMCASIGIPLFIYGVAIGLWASSGVVPWVQALALLVTISLLATVTESGRLAGMLTAEVAMWSGVTWVSSLAGGITSMVIGGVIAVAAYLRQREIDLKLRLAVEEGVRIQTRAEEILADYEETGQGWF